SPADRALASLALRTLVAIHRTSPRVVGSAFLLITLGVWQALALGNRPDFVMPPTEIARHVVDAIASGELMPHVGASLARSLPGFVLGSALGIALGLLAGVGRAFAQTVSPVVFLTYPVPTIVFLPLFMLW